MTNGHIFYIYIPYLFIDFAELNCVINDNNFLQLFIDLHVYLYLNSSSTVKSAILMNLSFLLNMIKVIRNKRPRCLILILTFAASNVGR